MFRGSARIILSCLFVLGSQTENAQDNVGEDSTVVYPANYFNEWTPVTAQDMLDRIPGLSGGGSSYSGVAGASRSYRSGGGRGFGGGSRGTEILINGKRTAGKNNSTGGQLTRITSDQVDYIEIIRGTSGELDVRGSGQVINVILYDTFADRSIQYELSAQQSDNNTVTPSGSLSFSGQTGALDYQIEARSGEVYSRNITKENSVLGDFSPNDRIREIRQTDGDNSTISANAGYEISPSSSARFNAQFTEGSGESDTVRRTTDLKVSPNVDFFQREDNPSSIENWEIGADYEYVTDRGDRFKVLAISNAFTQARTRERWNLTSPQSEDKNLFLDSGSITRERIIRGSYTFDMFGGSQDIELGAERAQTILDSKLALGIGGIPGTPSSDFGGLVPVSISNSNSSVEEMRYEPFVIHNWIFSPRMSLETSVLYEDSEITQRGDVSKSRDFDFVKPKADFRYDLTPQIQLRGTIEKIVEQLTFNDFVAATDNRDEDSNVQLGNENLRQEWYWNYEFNAEYRLPNDIGVVSSRLYFEDWHDRIERIDVSPSDDDLQGANGNIGDGEKYGIDINSSTRMRMIGMPNLLVTGSVNVEDSKIKDPFLGIERRMQFSRRGRTTWSFRHDIPERNLNWGMRWSNPFDGNRKTYDLVDIELSAGDPFWSAFVEWVSLQNITFRLDADRIISDAEFCRERQRFGGRISSGILEEIEDQCSASGPTLSLRITGTF